MLMQLMKTCSQSLNLKRYQYRGRERETEGGKRGRVMHKEEQKGERKFALMATVGSGIYQILLGHSTGSYYVYVFSIYTLRC